MTCICCLEKTKGPYCPPLASLLIFCGIKIFVESREKITRLYFNHLLSFQHIRMWEMKNLISTYMTRRSNKKTARLTPEVDTRGLCITSVMNCQGHSLGERIFWGDSRCIKGRGIFLPASTPRAVKEVNPPPSLPLPASSPCFEWRAPPRQSASPS